ncbi:DUF3307 domain-containing protein [Pseudooceanicola nitratireducens]|uniref:DUF3307 domain-containing protein n=1 Tax=Pseudooceanicola nitratireducens TaxID=517719 RepID=UPI001C93F12F|nr:DUF3307 domain-containing protein [Pseudooceanicola nitratireducens]MBY6156893.1 DUF3307 domain-containing protein [Pseudooceanicola nitratireducens]
MTETFAALLLAHVSADFLLQSNWMAGAKQARHPGALLLHGIVVLATATLLIAPRDATAMAPLLLLIGAHLLIDLAKTLAPGKSLGAFLADQAAHLASLVAIAWVFPMLAPAGWLGGLPLAAPVMVLLAGAVISVQAGGYAIGLLVQPFGRSFRAEGLPRGGKLIGQLERGLIYFLILVGQPSAVGFLIAAKSVLRFDASRRRQKAAEYVIIGTLASFGWAVICAYAVLGLLQAYPPLGFLALDP